MDRNELNELLNKEFLTVREVMAALDVTRMTISRKVRLGQLDGVNINPGVKNVWRIRPRSLKRLLGIDDQIPA